MKLRQKFSFYNFILIAAPILLIGVLSVIFIVIFILKFPVENMQITRASLINPLTLTRAAADFIGDNPTAITYIFIWAIMCIIICVITNTLITRRMVSSLEHSIHQLRSNVDTIRDGNLNFEVMGSDLDEIDDLCEGFDSMRRALIIARDHENQLKHERNMLIADISHDLKTPITSIKGYIDGINDGIADTPEKLAKYLNTIKSKAELIDELVSNLSMFAKLEVSSLKFNMTTGDLRELVFDVVDSFRLDFEHSGIQLEAELGTEPLYVNIDGEKMRRVFNNLLDNALKYRLPESKTVKVKGFLDDGNAYIVIEDDGMGIAPNEIDSVYDSFYRADNSRSSHIKGNGLGLGIAKKITERHHGRLWLRSEGLNMGTTATVCLPITTHGGDPNEKNTYN